MIYLNQTFQFDAKKLESSETVKPKLILAPLLFIYSPKDRTEFQYNASLLEFMMQF